MHQFSEKWQKKFGEDQRGVQQFVEIGERNELAELL